MNELSIDQITREIIEKTPRPNNCREECETARFCARVLAREALENDRTPEEAQENYAIALQSCADTIASLAVEKTVILQDCGIQILQIRSASGE